MFLEGQCAYQCFQLVLSHRKMRRKITLLQSKINFVSQSCAN